MVRRLRLGINIDHVATLRNARGGEHPCPIRAALEAKAAGADGITAHLREDRRHIKDKDIERLKAEVPLPLNLEMAMTEEMLAIALRIKPHAVCLVPERREELTTEGGLDAIKFEKELKPFVKKLQENGSRVSLFIAPDMDQVEAAIRIGARAVELHTGRYASCSPLGGEQARSSASDDRAVGGKAKNTPHASPSSFGLGSAAPPQGGNELLAITAAAALARQLGLEVHAGHGLNYENVAPIAAIPEIVELNIGHFLVGEAMFVGLAESIKKMRALMNNARHQTPQQVRGDR